MSRRWYSHEGRMVFVGWDRPLERYFLTIADLCTVCDGTGEEPGTDNFCSVCHAEGVDIRSQYPARRAPSTLDGIAAELSTLNLPFPDHVRRNLERDGQSNLGEVVHDYDLDTRPS